MRIRILLTLLVAVALAAPATAVAAPASVKVTGCRTGSDDLDRSATFRARMKAIPGSVRMRMRFELVGQPEAAGAQNSQRTVIGSWRRSNRGVTTFSYSQKVRGLDAGLSYQAVVKFRWYDEHGHVIQRAKRRSGKCVQDRGLSNLELLSVRVSPGRTPGTARYSIDVGNTGDGPAESFAITLFVTSAGQEAEVDSRDVDRLDPGDTETIRFTGPACSSFRAVVDRGNAVPETIEDDNVLKSRC
jgi:hypothetical protein